MLDHEHTSLALAQRCSGVPDGTPLFSSLLNYRHNELPSNGDTIASGIEILRTQERTNYPSMLSVEDYGTALGLTTQIVQLLNPSRMSDYMHQALSNLAKALEHTPNIPVRQLDILPVYERELLLETWNATKAPYSDRQCIHQLFEV
ncbi:hypothetical protein K7432_001188 [Basidiobolus ranarum]|uniref:Uncharacterized protein n=1 Tax=Basidiobolus ranarum TaxID=34480 RepID=A0ABR2X3C5_9FUNG